MIKVIKSVAELNLQEHFNAIESKIQWSNFGLANRQAGLQYLDGEDPWASAVGKSQGKDLEYTNLNPIFKNTIFETLINDYNLTRTRFMWVGPNTCYVCIEILLLESIFLLLQTINVFLYLKEG